MHVGYLIPFDSDDSLVIAIRLGTIEKKNSRGRHLVTLKFLRTFPSREAAYFLQIPLPTSFQHHEATSPHVSATLNIYKSPMFL